jgi:hypothetical protein
MNKRRLLITLLTIVVLIALFDDVRCRLKNKEIEHKLDHSEYLMEIQDRKFKETVNATNKQIKELERKATLISDGLKSYDHHLNRIKRLGISDPVKFLRNDLMNNQDLIPNRETPKGTMYFWKDHIYVLNHKWVIAYYEEGHFGGYLLASYEIDNNRKVKWNVLDHTD